MLVVTDPIKLRAISYTNLDERNVEAKRLLLTSHDCRHFEENGNK